MRPGMMKVVQEMYARGFEFVPIDIFSAQCDDTAGYVPESCYQLCNRGLSRTGRSYKSCDGMRFYGKADISL